MNSKLISDVDSCSEIELPSKAIEFAAWILKEGNRTQTKKEKKQQRQIAGMIEDPNGKIFTSLMADQAFRSQKHKRAADQLLYLLEQFGIPRYLPPLKKAQMKALKMLCGPLSSVVIPTAANALRRETKAVILAGEEKKLKEHIEKRHREGVRVNLNHLGEAILGEEEALRRLEVYVEDLKRPEVEYISIKISTIYSQINLLAWDQTLQILSDRLQILYRAAKENDHIRPDGTRVQKFVNLDMEEYRDLRLTVELFKKVLSEEEFKHFSAGIVLQAYIPDSFSYQKELTAWALQRYSQGGAPIKIRIVKGANLSMERVEASLRGWNQAPYDKKIDVDANYKRMLHFGCDKKHVSAVHLGIASHNIFDIAYAFLLRKKIGIEKELCFEMLEGMAPHLSRVVQNISGDMLLYCPAAKKQEFQNAIAYLIRRLDENTSPDNFLRHVFGLKEGSSAWEKQTELFKDSFKRITALSSSPRRLQNRLEEPKKVPFDSPFQNEPDTDFSLEANQIWARNIIDAASKKQIPSIPLVIAEREIFSSEEGQGEDPSIPNKILYKYAMATEEEVEISLKTAVDGAKEWAALSVAARSEILHRVAECLRRHRADLIVAMIADGGKTLVEADIEVSEAIDMAEYYRRSREELETHKDLRWTPIGTVLVTPPWNFPCAIPAGGIIASLMAGNSVIFKPARETIWIGFVLAQIFWEAGVPKSALQFLTGSSSIFGKKLITDPRVSAVVLTGSTATAKHFLKMRPSLHLMAETGGKNSIIVTNLADKDLAIKESVHSAFGHAGQKCSAASLLILEKEVYDDLHFRDQLKDAAASLKVGSAWDLSTKVGPIIHPPESDLLKGLSTLDPGEFWLLEPKPDPRNPNIWSPGIKWGIKEGSFMHQTELFGPVLGVMCANDLDHAIRLANGTRYGLTAGLHSLDEREHAIWLQKIEAGNCYINRSITGAIVRRQPFGGCKESCFGPGPKAGGPNYLIPLLHAETVSLPHIVQKREKPQILKHFEEKLAKYNLLSNEWEVSIQSYLYWWDYFATPQDPSQILGQDNFLQYLPRKDITLRWHQSDSIFDLARVIAIAIICDIPLHISSSQPLPFPCPLAIEIIQEDEARFLFRLKEGAIGRLRLLSLPSKEIVEAASVRPCYIVSSSVFPSGRAELLHYLREVAISIDYHRYGNLGQREASGN